MSKKKRSGYHVRKQMKALEIQLFENGRAMDEGPQKKKWTKHDVRSIRPLTPAQEEMFHAFYNGGNICAHGSAGTGKTFLALYLALNEILTQNELHKIIIVRSPVQLRELGHMPGDLEDKISFYETPYKDIMAELCGRGSTFSDMKEAGLIEFMPTTFIRGLTWDNAIVIVDEGQNMTFHEINSVMTRLGQHSRIIFTGDLPQSDLTRRNDISGMEKFMKVAESMESFDDVAFTKHDIVRSDFVKEWIIASEEVA
jgi:phosphate starvation-inducible protein PhoH